MSIRSVNYRNRIRYGQNWYGKKGKRKQFVRILSAKQNGKCADCKENLPIEKVTLDHIQPLSEGGKHEIENIQLLCQICHTDKDRENNRVHGIIGSKKKFYESN